MRDFEKAEDEKFWTEVRATLGSREARADLQRTSEEYAATLTDGLEPEGWSAVFGHADPNFTERE